MQTFTKIEIEWISYVMRKAVAEIRDELGEDDASVWMLPMWNLRAEQYTALADRLDAVLRDGDKRIAIKY